MQIDTLIADYPYTSYVLLALGALIAIAFILFLLYLLYHVVRGFFIACSYIRWSLRVMKVNGRKPRWKRFIPTFLSAWGRYIGHDGSLKIYSGASVFIGWGNYSVVKQGRFVDEVELGPNALDDIDDDDDELFEEDFEKPPAKQHDDI